MNHMHHHDELDQKFLTKIAFLDSRQRGKCNHYLKHLLAKCQFKKITLSSMLVPAQVSLQFHVQRAHSAKCMLWILTDVC